MRRIILSLILLFSIVRTQEYAGYAGSYLENGTDAQSIALGNALTAGTDLHYQAFFNPAGIANNPERKALFAHQFLSLDRRQSSISVTLPLPPVGGISVGWVGAGVNDIQGRDLTGAKTEILSASEDMLMVSFGIMPMQKLQVGGSVKLLQNTIPNLSGNISTNSVGFDFGAMYQINDQINLGVVLKNLNATYQWSNDDEDDLTVVYEDKFPIQLRSGIQYKGENILVVGDIGTYFIDKEYLDFNYRFGVEYNFRDSYFLRSGFRGDRFSFGVGLKQAQFEKIVSNLNYTLVIEPVGGLSHIISYAVNF